MSQIDWSKYFEVGQKKLDPLEEIRLAQEYWEGRDLPLVPGAPTSVCSDHTRTPYADWNKHFEFEPDKPSSAEAAKILEKYWEGRDLPLVPVTPVSDQIDHLQALNPDPLALFRDTHTHEKSVSDKPWMKREYPMLPTMGVKDSMADFEEPRRDFKLEPKFDQSTFAPVIIPQENRPVVDLGKGPH